MPIEFRCDQCGKLLRTGDETAGKQAKCPSCGTVQPIPTPLSSAHPPASRQGSSSAGSPFAAGDAPPLVPAPDAEVNPYQSPLAPTTLDYRPGAPPVAGAFQPTPIDAGDILNRTWEILKSQFWMCTLAASAVAVCNVVFNFVVGQVVTALLVGGGARLDEPSVFIPYQIGIQIPNLIFSTWLEGGLAVYLLKIARGQDPSIADVFSGGAWYMPLLGARALLWLICLVGFLLCLVPGIIFGLMYGQYFYLIVDRRLSASDSFGMSGKLTNGNKLHVFVLHLATVGVALLGWAACCIGIFPAVGYIQLMWAVTYLAISGQPTVDQWLNQPAAGQQTAAPSPLR